jgi:hypothetical protein
LFAVKVGEVPTPPTSVTVELEAKVPLAPLPGAVKVVVPVTVLSSVGEEHAVVLASTTRRLEYVVPSVADCELPLTMHRLSVASEVAEATPGKAATNPIEPARTVVTTSTPRVTTINRHGRPLRSREKNRCIRRDLLFDRSDDG